jgi:hypothetical protein
MFDELEESFLAVWLVPSAARRLLMAESLLPARQRPPRNGSVWSLPRIRLPHVGYYYTRRVHLPRWTSHTPR